MKRIAAVIGLLAVCMGLSAATPDADPYAADYATVESVILFAVNDKPAAIVFIAKDGKHQDVSIQDCKKSPECIALVEHAGKDNKLDFITVTDGLTT